MADRAYGGSSGGFFDGLIDNVRVYNRALSATEVQNDMNLPVGAASTDTSPPTAPGTLSASGGLGQISLNWGAATDDIGVARYDVYRGTSSGFTPSSANRIAQPTGLSYTDTNLAPGTYYYKVAARRCRRQRRAPLPMKRARRPTTDTTPPTAPGNLGATTTGTGPLTWTAATDDVGVTKYDVYRATTPGFAPNAANRIAQPTGLSYTDSGLAVGTYYYKVAAEDAAGNVGAASNEVTAMVTAGAPPTVSITAPATGTVSGVQAVTASASSNQGVAGVQFKLDGQNLGAEDSASPYSVTWDTRAEVNGSHTLTAVVRDIAGNTASSAPVGVTVSNSGVSTAGLQAAYSLDENGQFGSAALDTSGNYRTGTLVGGSWTTAGRYGGAVSLSGSNSEIDLPALGTFYKTGFTLEAWVYKQTSKVDVGVVGAWVSGAGGPMIWVDHVTGHYRLTFGTTFSNYLDSGISPAIGRWQNVAATYDGAVASIYVDGTLAASSIFMGNVGDSNTWRIGAYNSPANGFLDGAIDNVRIYSRALSASEIQTDMATRIQPDLTPPAVTSFTPADGATGLNVGSSVTAGFSKPMQAATLNTNTFQLKDPTGNVVPATVTYDAGTNRATLAPQAALKYATTYRAVLPAGGASDLSGNPLASDVSWSFTTEASPPPLLVVTSSANPYGMYLTEILRNEGLDAFTTLDRSLLAPAVLSNFDVVLLGDTSLSASQVTTLSNWVSGGGKLIAMHPDKQLASLLGLTSLGTTRTNAYPEVNTASGPGVGITDQTIQYHGMPTATPSTARARSQRSTRMGRRLPATRRSACARSAEAAARRPPSATTWPARSSSPARATRPGPGRSATASSACARTTCSSGPRAAMSSPTGSTRARSRSRRPTSSSACSST